MNIMMNDKWKNIKNQFLDEIATVTSYDDFFRKMCDTADQNKGDYFEFFAKLYFTLVPENRKIVKEYMLYDEIPNKLKKKLVLPTKDKGIDALIMWTDDSISAVQVKYRSNKKKTIPFGELSTFPALLYGTRIVGIKTGVLFTSCYDVCDEMKGAKYQIINDNSFNKCDGIFWENVKKYIMKKPIIKYILKQPLSHQQKIISLAEQFYIDNKFGRLYMPCGTGKSLMGLWIAKKLNAKKIFISVPSLYLLSETFETWAKEYAGNGEEKISFLLIGSDVDDGKREICEFILTTDEDTILEKLDNVTYESDDILIVITTYQSSNMLIKVSDAIKFSFDLGIFDEAHRTTGCDDKMFTALIGEKDISTRRLYMTATEKVYAGCTNAQSEKVYSMDNVDDYGNVIYKYSTCMAIDDNQLVDYQIIAAYITNKEYMHLIANHKIVNTMADNYDINIIFTCLMIINAMKEYGFQHLLVFSNTNSKAEQIMSIIDKLLENDSVSENHFREDVFTNHLDGTSSMTERRKTVSQFEKSKYGIISSVHIFGEGVNIVSCDAVCFADNKSSTIDIQQYIGRCLRLCKKKPNKQSYVLVPFIMDDENIDEFMENNNSEYSKIRNILRSMATTDEMIQAKFSLKKFGNVITSNNVREYDDEYEICGSKLSIDDLKEAIIAKALDRMGNPISEARSFLNHENQLRYANFIDLLVTKTECLSFLEQNNKTIDNFMPKNWFRFAVGNNLYDKLKDRYYYNAADFKLACDDNGIYSTELYKKRHSKDTHLPPISYINSGFYFDMDPYFTISTTLGRREYRSNYDRKN